MDPWIPRSESPIRNAPQLSTRNQGMSRLGCTLALAGLLMAPLQAQTVQLDMGMDVAGPGQHVSIPVTLSSVAGSTLTRLVLEATFSGEKLVYSETLPGAAVEPTQVEIEAGVSDLPDEEGHKRLRVEMTSSQGLPPGELLLLSFQISENAELNEDIFVTNISRRIETSQGEGPQTEGSDGIVTVITNAFFACFFYMH